MNTVEYRAWVRTPGGGTYYFAVMGFELVLTTLFFPKSHGVWTANPLDAKSWLIVVVTVVCLLALVYWGGKLEEKEYSSVNNNMTNEEMRGQVSNAQMVINDYVLPPSSLSILTITVWFSLREGFAFPDWKIMILMFGTSLLTLLYPLAQRLYIRRQ